MNTYREKLKLQNYCLAAAIIALAAVQVLSFCQVIKPITGDSNFIEFWNGFIGGVALGIMIFFIIGLITNLRAMHSEDRLKKQYAKSNDERTAQIHEKGKSAGVTIFLICMMPATIISGYFSITVFLTCLACTLVLSLTIGAAKLYYSKKY